MKKVVVASKNFVKLNAIQAAFFRMFPNETFEVIGLSIASGVPDQPMGDEETLRGAENRVLSAMQAVPEADYWAAIEGGCDEHRGKMTTMAWVVIRSRDGIVGEAKAATFYLPEAISKLVRGGMELGAADDVVTGQKDSKLHNGTIGFLTGNIITRTSYYESPAIMALTPHRNPELYGRS